jgi:hypothetical protein
MNNDISQKLGTLKSLNEDFEFYPTTPETMEAMKKKEGNNGNNV